jgi:chromosome partitioning protein
MRLACSNQKGGAGKTTTTINVAGALNQRNNDVLLIDSDPQGHATEGLGFEDQYLKDGKSLYDVLPDIDRKDELSDLILEHPEMDVIPAHEDMINLEDALSGVPNRENRLNLALDELDYAYDYVLIDCPPNLGVLTDNAILATENVIIPAQAKSTSIRAIEILFKQLSALEGAFGVTVDEVALVANEVGTDGENVEMMDWFKQTFKDRCEVFEVRKRVALQRAWNNGVSIFEHDETCDMQGTYLEIAEHVEGYDG